MKIMNIYGIPIWGNDCNSLDIDQDSYTVMQKYYSKYGADYDLITAVKNGDDEANILLEKLWQNKCYLYWNYKNECDHPSFLYDYIIFQNKNIKEQEIRIKSYNLSLDSLFKKMHELVESACTLIKPDDYERTQCVINRDAIVKLCDFINQGVDEEYRKTNQTNIRKIFELISNIMKDEDLVVFYVGYESIYLYSKEIKDLLNINIMLPVEGLVSGIYLLEVYHSSELFKNIVYESLDKSSEYNRNEAVRNTFSTSSSMKSKLEKYDVVSLKLDDGKKISKGKKASWSINLIQDLRDYTNYRYDDDYEEPNKITDILEVIRSLPIEYSLYDFPIADDAFKRCVFFRSELLRHLGFSKTAVIRVFKESRGEIFYNMDKVDSAVRRNLKVVLDINTDHDYVIQYMNNVKERVEKQLPEIHYGDFRRLKNEDGDLEEICIKEIRWIDSQYTAKILDVSREQSDHVRQIKFPEPTDKQKKMFKEALRDYRWLWEFDNSWLDEYLGIDDDERIKLDGKVNRFMKKINNEALVGSGCEPDNIQKILIYQLCASEDSLYFSSDRKYYISGRKKECTLKKILDPKAKQDVKVSIWLNALMRKQFYVNLGYEEVFDITEDCHKLIADAYKEMLEKGLYRSDKYEKYSIELNKIINNLI